MKDRGKEAMYELLVLMVGAAPFLVGLYALKLMRDSNDNDADDLPPPDPNPPTPVEPLPPRPRRRHTPVFSPSDRTPIPHRHVPTPSRRPRVSR